MVNTTGEKKKDMVNIEKTMEISKLNIVKQSLCLFFVCVDFCGNRHLKYCMFRRLTSFCFMAEGIQGTGEEDSCWGDY